MAWGARFVFHTDLCPLPREPISAAVSFAAARPPRKLEPFREAPRGTKPSRLAASASIMVDILRGNKKGRPGLLQAMICKSAKQRAALLRYECLLLCDCDAQQPRAVSAF